MCGAGADAEEAESDGEEAACMKPDRAQVSRDEGGGRAEGSRW